ncbi:hypothetical protein FPV67DRAFT_1728519 [Lyophyllum atratum]|nr:hypothetical protein FPV67DRAFT_1728519 [Lyophyllum atratum]
MAFTILEARITSLFVECVVLGLYLVTFGYTILFLFSKGPRWKRFGELNHPMVIVVMLMFFNTTVATALSLHVFWRAFVLAPPGTAVESFKEISYWAVVMKSATLMFQTIIADAILIYRCWVVYHRSWLKVAFSILLWLGGIVCAIFMVYHESTFKEHVLVSVSKLRPFGVAFWASSVTLNIITTALLVWPIWKVARHHEEYAAQETSPPRRSGKITMKRLIRVIIESGLLYTVVALVTFVVFTIGDNSLYVVSGAEIGIAGIAFNLIIIRTSQASRIVTIPQAPSPSGSTVSSLRIVAPRFVESRGKQDEKGSMRFSGSRNTTTNHTTLRQIDESEQESDLTM